MTSVDRNEIEAMQTQLLFKLGEWVNDIAGKKDLATQEAISALPQMAKLFMDCSQELLTCTPPRI